MPANALKARWVVTAGIILGQPIEEHTQVWEYTSADHASDTDGSVFRRRRDAAHSYAANLNDPRFLNWVDLQFMWM